jgi:AcrR family transcriptional regulator
VIAATLKHLAEDGYQGMSMDTIAATAGVGKPSIYRRWASKADLATAALSHFQTQERRVVGSDTRQRLVSHLRVFRKSLLRPNGMAMLGTILAEEHRTPELLTLFRDRIISRRRQWLKELLEQGVAVNDLRTDADLDAAVNLLVGSFYARYLAGQAITDEWPERAVAMVWPAIAAKSSPR